MDMGMGRLLVGLPGQNILSSRDEDVGGGAPSAVAAVSDDVVLDCVGRAALFRLGASGLFVALVILWTAPRADPLYVVHKYLVIFVGFFYLAMFGLYVWHIWRVYRSLAGAGGNFYLAKWGVACYPAAFLLFAASALWWSTWARELGDRMVEVPRMVAVPDPLTDLGTLLMMLALMLGLPGVVVMSHLFTLHSLLFEPLSPFLPTIMGLALLLLGFVLLDIVGYFALHSRYRSGHFRTAALLNILAPLVVPPLISPLFLLLGAKDAMHAARRGEAGPSGGAAGGG